jgi:hypothetical protein
MKSLKNTLFIRYKGDEEDKDIKLRRILEGFDWDLFDRLTIINYGYTQLTFIKDEKKVGAVELNKIRSIVKDMYGDKLILFEFEEITNVEERKKVNLL